MPYIELHAKSAFSFLEGASIPEALASVCAERGLPAMALLDRDGVYGAPRFHHAAKKTGIRALIGSEITIRSLRSRRDAENMSHPERAMDAAGAPSRVEGSLPSQQFAGEQFGSSAVRQSILRASAPPR